MSRVEEALQHYGHIILQDVRFREKRWNCIDRFAETEASKTLSLEWQTQLNEFLRIVTSPQKLFAYIKRKDTDVTKKRLQTTDK